ncbi:MAG: histidine kinase [Cyclobacteriaceae bacterium]
MITLDKSIIPKTRWVQHAIFWGLYLLFYGILYGAYDENFKHAFIREMMYLPVKIVITYFALYFLLPRFLLKEHYIAFAIWFVLSATVAGVLQRFITYYLEYPMFHPGGQDYPLFIPIKIIKGLVGVYPVVFFAVAIKMLKYWYKSRQTQQELSSQKLEAELKLLKTQIHPHFLFNTLNNLYALTLKKADNAPAMVLKISDLINYMLYECNVERIGLGKEIKFIENYVEIEKMRFGDRLDFNLTLHGEIKDKKIPPLLLLPFFENAFKHGVSEELEASWVSATIGIGQGRMKLQLENSKGDYTPSHANGDKGIGHKNVKRRLELLYGEDYHLQILDEQDTYLVILDIPINH